MAHNEDQWRLGTMLHQYGHLLESGLLSDCTIVVGEDGSGTQEFLCHKLVLSRGSAVFCAMFYGGLREEGRVRVTDIDPEPFKKMLQYLYTEEFSIEDMEMATALCYAANKYQITNLVNKCVDFLKSVMLPCHVLKFLEFAQLISNTELQRFCVQRLQTQTQEIIYADTWVEANLSSVLTVLQQELLNIRREASLFKACIRWGKHRSPLNNELIRQLVAPALKLIRLRNLTPQEYIKYVYPTNIFDDKENLENMLSLQNSAYEVPDNFSNICTRRATPRRRVEDDGARSNRNRRQESRIQRGTSPYERGEPHRRICEIIIDD